MDIMKDLETLCDLLSEKIADKTRKIRNGGMNDGDLDTIDKLTHSLASVKKIMAFMQDDGYSGYWPADGSYRSMYRGSYARGPRRDGMGRYSRNDLADKMRELMKNAPDDRTHQEIQRMIEKLEA